MSSVATQKQETKHVKTKEFVLYLVGVFFYTTMTGMVGSYRSEYLVNVLKLTDNQVSLFNTLVSIIPFVLSFVISMYIDGRKTGKSGKFRPLTMAIIIPMAATLMLSFWAPPGLSGTFLMIYLVTVAVLWGAWCTLGNSINMVANVMTPNMKERDNIISFRSISSAVGNSAPLVVILVIALIWKDNKALQYIIGAGLCSVVGIITVLLGMSNIKERVAYTAEKKNPFVGFKDVLTNKYAWAIIISDTLKNFRQVSTYMGIFLAGALLGSTDKYLFFGLPTGIGTAVGMLLINMLLKKFNSKVLYIASGIYSLVVNVLAFAVGYIYFKNGSTILQIVFIVFLFLIGLQFGASNLLPSMFQADVLEDIEAKTGKRIDATLPFVISIGTLISGTIATALAPKILYGDSSIIQYVQATDLVPNPEQSLDTKILLLFFYTIVHGIMMFLAGVPFFFYKLTGETKEEVHRKVLEIRAKNEQ
ncbi:MAG: hypothetical protein E7557_05560 [Ruminococcaceae bacterium]|nr:hypothetical protein [Oscillospiraceae bacterium]